MSYGYGYPTRGDYIWDNFRSGDQPGIEPGGEEVTPQKSPGSIPGWSPFSHVDQFL